MRRYISAALGAATFAFVSTSAGFAADMPRKAVVYAAPVYNWSGFYAGVNAGYGFGGRSIGLSDTNTTTFVELSGVNSIAGNSNGALGGVQFGYNWQAGQMVYGVEADIDAANIKSSQDIVVAVGVPRTIHGEQKLDWLSTFRGRLGFTPTDRTLLYMTGGLAVGHGSTGVRFTTNDIGGVVGSGCIAGSCTTATSASKTMVGWTIGAGLEYAFAGNWSMKGEYLYYDLGSVTSTSPEPRFTPPLLLNGSAKFSGSVARLGINYKFQ